MRFFGGLTAEESAAVLDETGQASRASSCERWSSARRSVFVF